MQIEKTGEEKFRVGGLFQGLYYSNQKGNMVMFLNSGLMFSQEKYKCKGKKEVVSKEENVL